ncbi:hypothetical protein BB559_000127 [Furculomyces boomerangus]|uniref:PHD-type domain-containing protein n=1 Tax=Furculomyces boomerangus TaxID=61424 RepID=A0A2T9Z660_9FUNG|nr:hypothetical protein BB559_000127 [Furculomyces boomerangus]
MSKNRRFQIQAYYQKESNELPSKIVLPGGIELSPEDHVYIAGDTYDQRYSIARIISFLPSNLIPPKTRSSLNRPQESTKTHKNIRNNNTPDKFAKNKDSNNTKTRDKTDIVSDSLEISESSDLSDLDSGSFSSFSDFSEDTEAAHKSSTYKYSFRQQKKQKNSRRENGSGLALAQQKSQRLATKKNIFSDELQIRVALFQRPSDLNFVRTRSKDTHSLLAKMHSETYPITLIKGKCFVRHISQIENLSEWQKLEDHFYYSMLFDPYINNVYDIVPVESVHNVPPEVKNKLQSTYDFVICEPSKTSDLIEDLRACAVCNKWSTSENSMTCSVCNKSTHMKCTDPPLLKKPSKGYAWQCAPCLKKIYEKKIEEKLFMNYKSERTRSAYSTTMKQISSSDKKSRERKSSYSKSLSLAPKTSDSNLKEEALDISVAKPNKLPIKISKKKGEWPFRYFGMYSHIEDVLNDDDRINPRAGSRIGPKYQANIPKIEGSIYTRASTPNPLSNDQPTSLNNTSTRTSEPPSINSRGSSIDSTIESNSRLYSKLIFDPNRILTGADQEKFEKYMKDSVEIILEHMKNNIDFGNVDAQTMALETLNSNNYNFEKALDELKHNIESYIILSFSLLRESAEEQKLFENQIFGSNLSKVLEPCDKTIQGKNIPSTTKLNSLEKSNTGKVDMYTFVNSKSNGKNNQLEYNILNEDSILQNQALKSEIKSAPIKSWTPKELTKFEALVREYGSNLHYISLGLPTHFPSSVVLRFYRIKPTNRGKSLMNVFQKSLNMSKKSSPETNLQEASSINSGNIKTSRNRDQSRRTNLSGNGHTRCVGCGTERSTKWYLLPHELAEIHNDLEPDGNKKLEKDVADSEEKITATSDNLSQSGYDSRDGGSGAANNNWNVSSKKYICRSCHLHWCKYGVVPFGIKKLGVLQPGAPLVQNIRNSTSVGSLNVELVHNKPTIREPEIKKYKKPSRVDILNINRCAVCYGCVSLSSNFTKKEKGNSEISTEKEKSSNILKCSRCRLVVHPYCYGMIRNPKDLLGYNSSNTLDEISWKCDFCKNLDNPSATKKRVCVICNYGSIKDHPFFDLLELLQKEVFDPSQQSKSTEMFNTKSPENQENVAKNLENTTFDNGKKKTHSKWIIEKVINELGVGFEAMWKTSQRNWVHVICALLTPGVKWTTVMRNKELSKYSSFEHPELPGFVKKRKSKENTDKSKTTPQSSLKLSKELSIDYFQKTITFGVSKIKDVYRDKTCSICMKPGGVVVYCQGDVGLSSSNVSRKRKSKKYKILDPELENFMKHKTLESSELNVDSFKGNLLNEKGSLKHKGDVGCGTNGCSFAAHPYCALLMWRITTSNSSLFKKALESFQNTEHDKKSVSKTTPSSPKLFNEKDDETIKGDFIGGETDDSEFISTKRLKTTQSFSNIYNSFHEKDSYIGKNSILQLKQPLLLSLIPTCLFSLRIPDLKLGYMSNSIEKCFKGDLSFGGDLLTKSDDPFLFKKDKRVNDTLELVGEGNDIFLEGKESGKCFNVYSANSKSEGALDLGILCSTHALKGKRFSIEPSYLDAAAFPAIMFSMRSKFVPFKQIKDYYVEGIRKDIGFDYLLDKEMDSRRTHRLLLTNNAMDRVKWNKNTGVCKKCGSDDSPAYFPKASYVRFGEEVILGDLAKTSFGYCDVDMEEETVFMGNGEWDSFVVEWFCSKCFI